jgi:lipopolysaccharide export LptBFGC system permease protein LptF
LLRLQFYIFRRLAGTLALVVLVVSTVLFVGQVVRFLDRVPDLGLGFVLSVLPMFVPVTLSLTLPFAFLVAAVLTYGRLADDNEVLAARMAGIHPWAIAAPGMLAGAALSFFCLELHGRLAPAAIASQDNLRSDVFARFLDIVERGERNGFAHRDFKISWSRVEDGALADLHISRGGVSSPATQEIHAARGVLRRDPTGSVLVFTLKDFLLVSGEEGRQVATRGDSWVFAIPASELLLVQGGYAKPRALPHEDLLFRMYRSAPGSDYRRGIERELFGRLSLSLAPLVFAACGIPLALLLGRGTRAAAAVLSFGVAVAYFILWQFGSSLAAGGAVPPAPAMLAGDAILLGAGAVLMHRVVRR